MNTGKVFESCIQRSAPDYVLVYRIPDAAQSFGGSKLTRFSRKNPFDYIFWDSRNHRLYAIELKTVSGHSISFERSKGESGEIHYHQIEGLRKWSEYDGITSGFIIEFRDKELTFFLDIESFDSLINQIDKKSFNLNDLEKSGVPYTVIPQERIRTKYKYNLEILFTLDK